jgi:hypothetical protein
MSFRNQTWLVLVLLLLTLAPFPILTNNSFGQLNIIPDSTPGLDDPPGQICFGENQQGCLPNISITDCPSPDEIITQRMYDCAGVVWYRY